MSENYNIYKKYVDISIIEHEKNRVECDKKELPNLLHLLFNKKRDHDILVFEYKYDGPILTYNLP